MKRFLVLAVLLVAVALPGTAGVVLYVQETFESGATFNGLVTFTDNYSNVTAVDGWLVGGSYGNDHLTWIWDPSANWASSFGPSYGGNFLMDGTNDTDYNYWVTFTWDFSGAPNLVFASPGGVLSDRGGNNVNYNDAMVSGSISAVPEPASFVLLLGGLACIGILRRR